MKSLLKLVLNLVVLFSLLIFSCGCTAMIEAWDEQHDAKMRQYMYLHYSSYVAQFGNPQYRAPDGRGGEVLVWKFKEEFSYAPAKSTTNTNINALSSSHVSGSSNKYANSIFGSSHGLNSTNGSIQSQTTYHEKKVSTSIRTRTFYVNSKGFIYKYHWDGYSFGKRY